MALEHPTPETINTRIAHNITRLRKQRGLTLKELAAQARKHGTGLTGGTLSLVANGNRRLNTADLVILSHALDVSPLEFLYPTEDEPLTQEQATQLLETWLAPPTNTTPQPLHTTPTGDTDSATQRAIGELFQRVADLENRCT